MTAAGARGSGSGSGTTAFHRGLTASCCAKAMISQRVSGASNCRLLALVLALLASSLVFAQEAAPERQFGYDEGRIVEVDYEAHAAVVELSSGHVVTAELPMGGDFGVSELPEFEAGQLVELYFSPRPGNGERLYVVVDWIRRPALYWLAGLFFVVSIAVARFKGLRAFIATGTSLSIVIGFIVPGILSGWNPILISLLGVGGILVLAIYFVHGLNWSTTAALIGTFGAVLATMALGLFFTELAHLTGFGSEEAMMINIGAADVSLKGLVLAGLLVGALGALTDITIVQASVVRELAHVNPSFGLKDLYGRAMNVGLDHIGSLVNTLVLAYTGAALPLLVLLHINEFTFGRALNLELVAQEVIITLVGSIGLILAVPLTTVIASFMFRGDRLPIKEGELDHTH